MREVWPICTYPYCRHTRAWPDREVMDAQVKAHPEWVTRTGHATCVCHDAAGFPCDKSLEAAS